MKKTIFLILCIFTFSVYGGNEDTLRIALLQHSLDSLKSSVSILEQECKKIDVSHIVVEQQQDIIALRDSNSMRQKEIESLQLVINGLDYSLCEQDSAMRQFRIQAEHKFQEKESQVKTFAIIIILMSVFLILLAYFTYRIIKKGSRNFKYLFDSHGHMQSNYVKIEEECIRTTQLFAQILESEITNNPSQQIDHSLALKVADELVRIEANLSYIDSSIKGYKQLAKAIARIKENFLANGYEIVDMLGKPYHEGMKVVANFVMDDTLAEKEQKITGIIKPQINYNGKMIQSAQITVSQNL